MSQEGDHPRNEMLPTAIRVRLDVLERRGAEPLLREFAIWCAMQVVAGYPAAAGIVASVRAAALDASGEELRLLQERTSGAACGACTIGLNVNPAAASAQLAAIQSGRPDAYEAAVQASRHARDCFGYIAMKDGDAFGVTGRPALEAVATAMGCQIDQLDRLIASCEPPPSADHPTPADRGS